jgi:hypothetical protein
MEERRFGIPTQRKSSTIFDEDSALTLFKPFSGEHKGKLIVIHEDAYGEFYGMLTPIKEIKRKFSLSEEEFDEIVNKL